MTSLGAFEDLLLLLVVALVPALAYLNWIRRTERYQQEPWGLLLAGFGWGALIATLVAALIEALLLAAGTALSSALPGPETNFLSPSSAWNQIFLVLVIAPFVEEGLKGLGLTRCLGPVRTLADGPVVGASVGLGFGFFETFLYGLAGFLAGGLAAGIALVLIRSVSSVLLHGSSTAMFGYGYAKSTVRGGGGYSGLYYLVAVGMHASFNVFASLASLLPLLDVTFLNATEASLLGLLLAIVFAVTAIQHVRSLILQSNFPGATGEHPRYRPPVARKVS